MTDTLFDLDAYTVNPQDKPATNERWYLWVERDGQRYAMTQGRDINGNWWQPIKPKMTLPIRYDTYNGAKLAAAHYKKNMTIPIHIDVWTGKPKDGAQS